MSATATSATAKNTTSPIAIVRPRAEEALVGGRCEERHAHLLGAERLGRRGPELLVAALDVRGVTAGRQVARGDPGHARDRALRAISAASSPVVVSTSLR